MASQAQEMLNNTAQQGRSLPWPATSTPWGAGVPWEGGRIPIGAHGGILDAHVELWKGGKHSKRPLWLPASLALL